MSEKKRKGTPLWQISKKFNFAAEKIIPDSFVFCVVLTLVVAVLSLTVCHIGPVELLTSWWDGLSSQFTLAFQMGLMVVVCATCARSPQVSKLLDGLGRSCTHTCSSPDSVNGFWLCIIYAELGFLYNRYTYPGYAAR